MVFAFTFCIGFTTAAFVSVRFGVGLTDNDKLLVYSTKALEVGTGVLKLAYYP